MTCLHYYKIAKVLKVYNGASLTQPCIIVHSMWPMSFDTFHMLKKWCDINQQIRIEG